MCFLIFPTFKAWGGYSKAAAERRMAYFNTHGIVNTAWAFVTAGQLDGLLFTALAIVAEQHQGNFKAHALTNTGQGCGVGWGGAKG